jgi:hypothetical protein
MSIRGTFLAMAMVIGLASPGLAQPADIPQTQMGAVALLGGQLGLANWWLAPTFGAPPSLASVKIIDDHTARIHGIVASGWAGDIDVVKIDDCHFNVMRSSTLVEKIDLSVIGTEYRQGRGAYSDTAITFVGNGKGPAFCERLLAGSSDGRCYNDLTLGPGGNDGADSKSAVRTLRAVQFLQQTCPPARIGF